MGKTKQLAEGSAERESADSKMALEPTKQPSTIRLRGIKSELYQALITYLETKPYAEVSTLLISLSQTQGPHAFELDATIINK